MVYQTSFFSSLKLLPEFWISYPRRYSMQKSSPQPRKRDFRFATTSWGVLRRNSAEANPASLYRASPRFAQPFFPAAPQAGFPLRYNKLQGFLAKANLLI
jgi:hypothetical protein